MKNRCKKKLAPVFLFQAEETVRFPEGTVFARPLCWQADIGLGRKCEHNLNQRFKDRFFVISHNKQNSRPKSA